MAEPHVALVGAPNAGKTSLYNHLTGSNFRTVNYPGATVDFSVGQSHPAFGSALTILDTPGTYSLFPKSTEEKVTASLLFEGKGFGGTPPEVLVVVVDATQLRRHLLVLEQARRAGFKTVVALTMNDLFAAQGHEVNPEILQDALGVPVVRVSGLDGSGAAEVVSAVRTLLAAPKVVVTQPEPWSMEQHFQFATTAERIYERAVQKAGATGRKDPARVTQAIDSVLLHPIIGLVLFGLIMFGVFTSIFWLATPAMDLVDGGFSGLAEWVVGLNPDSALLDFLGNGLIAALGSVMVFVPQIMILFLLIGLLEDTGYLARAASLTDKPLAALGLNGRSFVPVLSGYACAIPAMMAARTINSRRERMLTLFIVPLMSCSARLPVYALLLSFLFFGQETWKPGLALALIYVGSLFMGMIAAGIAGRVMKRNESSFFLMELPFYRRPQLRSVLKGTWLRTHGYLTRAAPVIFVFAVFMWIGTNFPRHNGEANLQQSYLATAGKLIEPVMEPMGGDWRTGVSLISAFAAREVFVSSLAVMFNVAESEDEAARDTSLLEKMKEAKTPSGQALFTLSTVVGLILFFMISLQCIATVGVARREAGSWAMPLTQLVLFNVVGYGLAVAAVQGLRALGFA